MNPSPFSHLHSSLVHLPIILTLVGGAIAVVAAFLTRGRLPFYTAIVLALATCGVLIAINTGREAKGIARDAGQVTPEIRQAIDRHETGAERSLWSIAVATVIAAASAALTARGSRAAAGARALTAIAALVAAFIVYGTGDRGGELVMKHGLGPPRAESTAAIDGSPARDGFPVHDGFGAAPASERQGEHP